MGKLYDNYIESVRTTARKEGAAIAKAKIQAARRKDELNKRFGLSKPFDGLNYKQIQAMKKSGDYVLLLDNPEFVARVRLLEGELKSAMDVIAQLEDARVKDSILKAPPDVRLDGEHGKERESFLLKHGVSDINKAQPSVKMEFSNLVKRQHEELAAVTIVVE